MRILLCLVALSLTLTVPASTRSPVVATPVPTLVPAAYEVPAARYRWPLNGIPVVVRRFAPPPSPWLPGHRGVDLAGLRGSIVRAAGPGVVAFAGMVAGRG